MDSKPSPREVSVLLDGSLGEHLLGMRILRFIHDRYPEHDIVAYSRSADTTGALTATSMSPLISRSFAIHRTGEPAALAGMGLLDGIPPDQFAAIMRADPVVDARGESMFVEAAASLGIPFFDVLADRPELRISRQAAAEADQLLSGFTGATFVGLNLTGAEADAIGALTPRIGRLLSILSSTSSTSRVVVLNMADVFDEGLQNSALVCWPGIDVRPCVGLSIETTAALLTRCCYFVGLDNDIKQLAWALDVPHSFFCQTRPALFDALRRMPDLHRILLFTCTDGELDAHARICASSSGSEQSNATAR